MAKTLVMYSRSFGCPFVTLAKRVLKDYDVPYRELYIDEDMEARARVLAWTGFLSTPTLVVSQGDSVLPLHNPAPLPKGSSPQGVDRGDMLTEPHEDILVAFLTRHGFIT